MANLLTVLGDPVASTHVHAVLEYCAGGSLKRLLESVRKTRPTGEGMAAPAGLNGLAFPLAARATAQLASDTGVRAKRQMLHARSLAFTHPRNGERLAFEAAWPSDFEQVLDRLRGATTKTKP